MIAFPDTVVGINDVFYKVQEDCLNTIDGWAILFFFLPLKSFSRGNFSRSLLSIICLRASRDHYLIHSSSLCSLDFTFIAPRTIILLHEEAVLEQSRAAKSKNKMSLQIPATFLDELD